MNLVPWRSKAARLALEAFGPSVSVQDAYKFAMIYKHGIDMHDEAMPSRSGWSKGPSLLPRRYVEFDRNINKDYRGKFHEVVRIYEDEVEDYLKRVIALKTTTVTVVDDVAEAEVLEELPPADVPALPSPAPVALTRNYRGPGARGHYGIS